MPALSNKTIRFAFRKKLDTLSGIPDAGRRAWEARGFAPPNPPATYLRESLIPISRRVASTNLTEATGIIQYDVVFPAGSGSEGPEDLAAALLAAFIPLQSLVESGVEIAIDKAEEASIKPFSEGWEFIPVSIYYRAYTPIA